MSTLNKEDMLEKLARVEEKVKKETLDAMNPTDDFIIAYGNKMKGKTFLEAYQDKDYVKWTIGRVKTANPDMQMFLRYINKKLSKECEEIEEEKPPIQIKKEKVEPKPVSTIHLPREFQQFQQGSSHLAQPVISPVIVPIPTKDRVKKEVKQETFSEEEDMEDWVNPVELSERVDNMENNLQEVLAAQGEQNFRMAKIEQVLMEIFNKVNTGL